MLVDTTLQHTYIGRFLKWQDTRTNRTQTYTLRNFVQSVQLGLITILGIAGTAPQERAEVSKTRASINNDNYHSAF